jgi:isoquinoline 1-oxidoreductase beta subunit
LNTKSWGVPVEELSSANSVITHRPTGRTTTYGQVAPLAANTLHPHPGWIRIKPRATSAEESIWP